MNRAWPSYPKRATHNKVRCKRCELINRQIKHNIIALLIRQISKRKNRRAHLWITLFNFVIQFIHKLKVEDTFYDLRWKTSVHVHCQAHLQDAQPSQVMALPGKKRRKKVQKMKISTPHIIKYINHFSIRFFSFSVELCIELIPHSLRPDKPLPRVAKTMKGKQ